MKTGKARTAKTKLTLVTTPKSTPIVSTSQSRNRQNTALIAQNWSASDTLTKNAWQQTARQINASDHRTGKKMLSAYGAYTSINRSRLSCSLEIMQNPPQTLVPAQALPLGTTLNAQTNTGPSPTPTPVPPHDTGGFGTITLTLSAPAYPGLVQIFGSKPTLADKPVRPASGFVLLGTLNGIPEGGTDIADLYLSKFAMPTSGAQIALQIVPISPTGNRGVPMLLQAIVDALSATAAPSGDHELKRAA